MSTHYRWDGADLLLDIRGKPGARQDRFVRVSEGRLVVQIAAVAADGKATARLIMFLAQAFGVAKSSVQLVYGLASVNKQVRIVAPCKLPQEAGVKAPA